MTNNGKKIWVPPTPLDDNIKRMAWLLFLEIWKAEASEKFTLALQGGRDLSIWAAEEYSACLAAAKAVRAIETQATVRIEPQQDTE